MLLFASSRLNINFQFSKDFSTKCHFSEDIDHSVRREALPEYIDGYAKQMFVEQSRNPSLDNICTMVMLTYKRERLLTFLLNHYCKVKSLHKIIVIWNEVDRRIPDDVLVIREDCLVDLLFIQAKVNKLTNRFRPRPEIETDCKLWVHIFMIIIYFKMCNYYTSIPTVLTPATGIKMRSSGQAEKLDAIKR